MLVYAMVYKGLEHPCILVSGAEVGCPGTSFPVYQGMIVVSFWRVRSYMRIFGCSRVSAANYRVVQGSTVYTHIYLRRCVFILFFTRMG